VHTINKKVISKIGYVVAARVVQEDDDLTIMSTGGVILRTKVKNISRTGRVTKGVTVMNLGEGDSVASIARISAADLRSVGVEEEPDPPNA
jgi:DNA gyrase subunit A